MNQNNFVDYYEDLQVSPNADFETIERVYRLLAKRYHPDNTTTGNTEKFSIISTAYKVLSDGEKRAAFDAKSEDARNYKLKALAKASLTNGIEDDQKARHAILSVLYIDRRHNPSDSGVGSWRMEKLLEWPEKVLEFHLWYLKEKGWIQRVDNGGYAITASGVEIIEEDDYILGKDKLITYETELPKNVNKTDIPKAQE